jgi:hypothetical protein
LPAIADGTQHKSILKNMKPNVIVSSLAAILITLSSQAQVLVYDNLGTGATAGYSELNANNPTYGDTLTLTSAGTLSLLGLSLYNSTSGGNTGAIMTGTMLVNFYDNTTAYAGGLISNPLLGTATLTWDYTADGGLPPGSYDTATFDLSALNINLTQNVLITQTFTQTTGTSLRNGFVLLGAPVVGASPSTVYIGSTATAAGLYTFSGNPGQMAYQVTIAAVPEPTTLALAGLGGLALLGFRRRQ